MFLRSVRGTLFRQWKKMIMIAFTIALGASLASAMLSVMLDVGDKVNQELKTYGANITVVPKAESVLDDLYEIEGQNTSGAYLNEDDLGKIKTIFWAFNIVDFAPFVNAQAELQDGSNVTVVGSWYSHHMKLPTGEELDAGIESLRSWWELKEGSWLSERTASADSRDAMIGVNLAQRLGAKAGSVITVKGADGVSRDFNVTGVFDAGGEEDSYLYTYLANAQEIAGISGKIDSIEVSAITTPDNELAELATKNGPSSLTVSQYEKWYCTAYASSICWQIQEAIPNCIASPVRQVADSEGAILEKTQLLMILITILSLIGAALGICECYGEKRRNRSYESDRRKQQFHIAACIDRDLHNCYNRRNSRVLCGVRVCTDNRAFGIRFGYRIQDHGSADSCGTGSDSHTYRLHTCYQDAFRASSYRSFTRKIRGAQHYEKEKNVYKNDIGFAYAKKVKNGGGAAFHCYRGDHTFGADINILRCSEADGGGVQKLRRKHDIHGFRGGIHA